MTQRPAVLIMQRHLAPLSPILESAYDVYRFWEGPPIEAAHDIRALIVAGEAPLDKGLIERLPALDLIACFTSGYDGIDIDWCRERGLPVTHAPGVNHEDVADHALGLILAARRQIVSGGRGPARRDVPHGCELVGPSPQGRRMAAGRQSVGPGQGQRHPGRRLQGR